MNDWKYTFDPVTKAEWRKQIESDLYPKGIESIQSEWWPGEPMFPAHHYEDSPEPIILPGHLFEQPPRIMEWIDTTMDEAKNVNKKILDSLNYGVQSLVLHVDPNQLIPFRLWLDGVYQDMIDVNISLTEESPDIIHTIREIVNPGNKIRLYRKDSTQPSSFFLDDLQGSIDENTGSFRFVYQIPSSGKWTQETADVFRLVLDDLKYWKSQGFNEIDFLENCVLQFNPDTQYFKQLIQTRVIHLVWNNLWKKITNSNSSSSGMYLECHIDPSDTGDPDRYLIQSSASALTASLTGVHILCIHHLNDLKKPALYDRVDRNIHHLLHLESDMYKGSDPLSGSYSIDFYTRKWTEDIWDQLYL